VKKITWLSILFAVLVLGYLVSSSFRRQAFRCKICITYKGRSQCSVGAAGSEMEAQRTAIMTACGPISGGVIEANQCENTPPDSVEWLAGK